MVAHNCRGGIKCIEKKCIRQRVLTAGKSVRFPSNQTATDQFTAENVTLNADPHADSKCSNQPSNSTPFI
jgi:hypothetical protein